MSWDRLLIRTEASVYLSCLCPLIPEGGQGFPGDTPLPVERKVDVEARKDSRSNTDGPSNQVHFHRKCISRPSTALHKKRGKSQLSESLLAAVFGFLRYPLLHSKPSSNTVSSRAMPFSQFCRLTGLSWGFFCSRVVSRGAALIWKLHWAEMTTLTHARGQQFAWWSSGGSGGLSTQATQQPSPRPLLSA